MLCPKTKVVNENENNKNSKNVRKVINYVRKKKNIINNNNKNLFKKKKNNSTLFANNENIMINNKSDIKGIKSNYMMPNISDNRYKTNYISINNNKKREEVKLKKINNKTPKNEILINKNNIIKEKLFKLISNLKVLIHYYLKIYFHSFKANLSQTMNNIYEKNLSINANIQDDKIDKIDLNKIILEKCRQNKNFQYQNSFYNPTHKKSNSIIVNKKISSNTASLKELSKNNSNKNLSFLISKNLRFLSREKDIDYKNGEHKPELFRDSESLKKKYEQICRRKKRQLTMTYTSKFKDNISSSEGNLFSDVNKTNSFSALNDNNSVNTLKLKNNQMKLLNFNENNILTEKRKNLTDNKKNKNSYKIKLLKGYDKNKKIISYRIEKIINKNDINNNINIIKDKNLTETNYEAKNISNNDTNKKIIYKKNSFNSRLHKNYIGEINKLNRKIYIHKKKSYLLDDMPDFKLKDINNLKGKKFNIKNNNISLSIKNISSRDKRISINIRYIPYNSKPNKESYDNTLLKKENAYHYQYLTHFKKIKNIIKRKNELVNKLSLIREEDEKSRYLNSTKSSKIFEEEINAFKINLKKEKSIIISSMIRLLQNNYLKFLNDWKKEFIYKIKAIYFIYFLKKIVYRRIKDTYFVKYYFKKKSEGRGVYCSKIKNKSVKANIQQISNIYIKDKIFLNNIIINENILSSHSFDFQNKFNNFDI